METPRDRSLSNWKTWWAVGYYQYWYDQQIRRYILQFIRLFDDFSIKTGKKDNSDSEKFVRVPVRYADMSRMVRTKLWTKQDDHSYNGSGSDERLKFRLVISYKVKPGSYQWDGLRKRLVEAHEKSGSSARFSSFRLHSGDVTTFSLIIPFDSWKDYTSLESTVFNKNAYDSVHGEGSWEESLKLFTSIVKEREVHVREYLPELSSE